MCHCGNMGIEWAPNKSQYTKLTLEKKILPPLLPGLELETFRSRVRRSYQQAIPAPHAAVLCVELAMTDRRKRLWFFFVQFFFRAVYLFFVFFHTMSTKRTEA